MATWSNLGSRSRRVVQAQTESTPTTSTTDGIVLDSLASVVAILQAPAGQTFDGTGNMLGYVYADTLQKWVAAPNADVDMAEHSGRNTVSVLRRVDAPRGLFQLIPVSVGLSSGTQITTDYVCTEMNRGTAL